MSDPKADDLQHYMERCAALRVEVDGLRAALIVERNYWQTRSHLVRTKTEEVMAEWHLDLIDAALGGATDE